METAIQTCHSQRSSDRRFRIRDTWSLVLRSSKPIQQPLRFLPMQTVLAYTARVSNSLLSDDGIDPEYTCGPPFFRLPKIGSPTSSCHPRVGHTRQHDLASQSPPCPSPKNRRRPMARTRSHSPGHGRRSLGQHAKGALTSSK